MIEYVLRNGIRRRIGESHPNCTIPEAIVEQVRKQHSAGVGLRTITRILNESGVRISFSSVRRICDGSVRGYRAQIIVDEAEARQGMQAPDERRPHG